MVEANPSAALASTGSENNKDAAMSDQLEEEKQTSTGEHTQENQINILDATANMRELTNIELLRKAEDCVEKLKLETAVSLYDEGVRRFPNDTLIMDQYTDLLIQLGESERAKQLIERSIQLNPEKDGQKYLNMAEMLCGADAVQMYQKGITVLRNDAERFTASLNEPQAQHCMR